MNTAAQRTDDTKRLRALRRTGLLDAAPSASFDRLTRMATELVDVPVALVSLVDADRQFFASCVGLPADVSALRETPLSHSFCVRVVAREEALVLRDAREHPELRDNLAIPDLGVVAYLGIPISHPDGTVIGSFCAIDHRPRDWTEREIALMRDLAASVDTEIALHVTLEAERGSRRLAEDANTQLQLLAEASGAFAESLEWRETLETLARLAVPALADWCAVDLLEGGRVQRLALAHRDGDDAARLLLMRYPPRLDGEHGVGAVLRTGRPTLLTSIDDAYLDLVVYDEQHRAALRAMGVGSAAIIPLTARGRTLGALSFVAQEEGRYAESLLPLLLDLGRRAALAVDNALLFQSTATIAATLQQSLLPPSLPDVPGIDIGVFYRSSAVGTEVGGDFYDIFEVPDGRWLAVVGDVVGKGPAAAAVTGLARHTLRAAAMREAAPSRILDILNDVLLTEGTEEDADTVFATVAAAAVRIEDHHAVVTLSSGGHPTPLLRRADGTVEEVELPGTVLGVVEACELLDDTVDLGAGDLLLLYTDGVTEARRADGTFLGTEGLIDLLAAAPQHDVAKAVAEIGAAVDRFQEGQARDDVAMLAIQVRR